MWSGKRDTEQKAIVALSGSAAWNAGPLKREGKMFLHTNRPLQKRSCFLEIPPKTFAWNIQPFSLRSTFSRMGEGEKKKKRRKRRNQTRHVCMHDNSSGRGKEKQKQKKKMEERIVVKLRRKQRSRWNNAMFYAWRLTFPRNYASRNNGK